MEAFYFLIYVMITFAGTAYGIAHNNIKNSNETIFIFSLFYGILAVLILTLSYNAGLFVFITEYSGTMLWFGIWLFIYTISFAAVLFQGKFGVAILSIISMIFLSLTGGLDNLFILLNVV